VLETERHAGIGTVLLLRCLRAMREDGYGYAIIGSAGPVDYYRKVCGATVIEGSSPGIYSDLI
ncbi:MAG: GNAT family N-acetyltransferase, partial [Eubacteriales bacterium]|nr:GNAT family N-acetyltransferase [Eubacteriales bacterium]